MKKKFASLFAMFFIIVIASTPAFAAKDDYVSSESAHHVIDYGKLSDKDRTVLEESAAQVYEVHGIDIFVCLNSDALEDAENTGYSIYGSNAYGDAAVVMLRDSENFYIYAYGRASKIFTRDELDEILSDLPKKGGNKKIFLAFINTVDEKLTEKGVQPIPDERLLPRLIDDADLLTQKDGSALIKKLDRISENRQLDVVVITKFSLDGKTSTQYADDFFDYNGYGCGDSRDGILLLIGMENRDWAISTHGKGIDIFTDEGQKYMTDKFVPYLSSGDYYGAFNKFADMCDEFIIQYDKTEKPYDYDNMPKKPFDFRSFAIGSCVLGLIAGFVTVTIFKRDLKSVAPQAAAGGYTKPGSLKITNRSDLFLYNVVNRTERPRDDDSNSRESSGDVGGSSTHHSSSGESHGGSSGNF